HVGGRIDAVFYCPHAADVNCDCRKPKPGLLEEIASRYGIPLAGVPCIGDSLRDLQAAAMAGARPAFVVARRGLQTAAAGGWPANTEVYPDLYTAAYSLTR